MMKGLLVASALALAGSAQAGDSTCTRLTDSTASIYSAISYIADKTSDMANLPLYELMAPIDNELPWLSTCLGSANVLVVGLGLLSNPQASQCLGSLTGSDNGGFSLMPSENGTGDMFATSLCPMMNSTIFPCVDTVLAKAVNDLIASGGDCCTDMAARLPELLGQDLKSFLQSLMIRVGDILCSVKTIVDEATGETTTETCGTNLIGILGGSQGLEDIIQMLKIPNDQACAAMKGKTFTATGGGSYRFFGDKEALDSCFAPMNLLFTDLANLPMIANSSISQAFAADQCFKGETILDMSLNETGMMQGFAQAFDGIVSDMKLMPPGQVTKIVRAGFEDMQKDLGPMCFHIANSVNDCVYDTQIAYAFSKDTPPQAGGSGGNGAPEPANSGSSNEYQGAALVCIAVTAAASIWIADALRS